MVFEEKEYMIGDKKILLRSAKTEEDAGLSIVQTLELPFIRSIPDLDWDGSCWSSFLKK